MDALFEEVQVRRTSGHETELGGDRGGVGRQGRRSEDNKARRGEQAVSIIRISKICEEEMNLKLRQSWTLGLAATKRQRVEKDGRVRVGCGRHAFTSAFAQAPLVLGR